MLGAVGGNPAKELEVLTDVTGEDLTLTKQLLAQEICEVKLLDTPAKLNIRVRCKKGADSSLVEILHEHNHIVHIERNGEVLYDIPHSLEDVSESGTEPFLIYHWRKLFRMAQQQICRDYMRYWISRLPITVLLRRKVYHARGANRWGVRSWRYMEIQ